MGRKKGFKQSKETKQKISNANSGKNHYNYGKHLSEETKKKMSMAKKGKSNGKHHSEETKKKMSLTRLRMAKDGLLMSKETREKLSEALKGHKTSEEARRKMSKAFSGRILSEEHKRKLSEAHRGEKGSNWRGGVTPENKTVRRSIEYRLWREAVFARDNWTCQKTGQMGGVLHPHHIKNFSMYPELRFAIDNGITLCKEAHEEFHRKYGKENNTREQLVEYLN